MRLQVFVNGPPGAGKTSLCKALCDTLGLAHVATGDLLRDNILRKTELGLVAKDCIARKTLVPDHVVVEMVADKVLACNQTQCGWILDGFPRTADQCSSLRRKQIVPTVAIVLDLNERECVHRLSGRRFDPVTSRIYHSPDLLPRDATVLGRLTKRSDDAPDKIAPRLDAYRTHGAQINDLFRSITHRIDALQPFEQVVDDVERILRMHGSPSLPPTTVVTAGATVPTSTSPQSLINIRASIDVRPAPIAEETEDNDDNDDDDMTQIDYSKYDFEPQRPPLRKLETLSIAKKVAASPTPTAAPLAATSSLVLVDREQPQKPSPQREDTDKLDAKSNQEGSPQYAPRTDSISSQVSTRAPAPAPQEPDQQPEQSEFAKFKDMLTDGFEVIKHGRRGSPHARLVYTDLDLKRIFWQKPSKDNRTKRAKMDQSVALADVVQVVRGMKTEVLRRTGDVSKYERYLSLVADDRTLDMELPNESLCEFLLHGFEQLLHGPNCSA
ncbi:TPA: hypothetical protein N0F65_009296 [Lagenidium giganteum]|uniref:Adenylate kinase n=1 Tax=Lagenidium giganteum TaxID=4803 RepID=A0AAV2YPS1_9STRA|nr:TPA: hypothetical protein N0F65_009296 [Lagenidium giganteum]